MTVTAQQRVAPGVPPQQYQVDHQQYQVPQHQQMPPQQHMPQQQQHMPQQHMPQQQQQFQQPPPVQQHVPHQQVPVQQYQQQPVPGQPGQPVPHHPHSPPQHGQLLNVANINDEKHHIREHLDVPIDTSKMSEQELQFHYFKMHDADNNNKLDGCELIKSLIHWHAETESYETNVKSQTDAELADMIDPILREMDSNNDGFVDYAEFKKAEA